MLNYLFALAVSLGTVASVQAQDVMMQTGGREEAEPVQLIVNDQQNEVTREQPNSAKKCPQIMPVNINTADQETLQQIKYFSKRKAAKIIEYREQNGGFKQLSDLLHVECRGIHQQWLDKVSRYLTV